MATNRDRGVQTTGPDLIMISDADEDAAGATIWWRLEGDVNREELKKALIAAGAWGTTHVPPTREPEVALRRAAANLRSKRRLLRPLARKGAWAIVEEQVVPNKDELKHWTGPTVALDKIGRPVITNATADEERMVKDAYTYYLDALTTEDVSSWLIDQAELLGATSLRKGGGFYYMPPTSMKAWKTLVEVLMTVQPNYSIYKVPTVRMTKDGAKAILDSLQAEIMAKVSDVTDDIVSGELGVIGLNNRADRASVLLRKVEEYEALLGTKLSVMTEALEKLQVDVAAAKLAAEAAAEDSAS